MPAVRAERLCPEAIFVAPDFTRYRAVSHSVREIFKRHTGLIEPLSLDEAYLDVTENKTGLATATLVARTIREQIRQELNLTPRRELRRTSSWQNSPRTGANLMGFLSYSLRR
jgi:DNA polymerase-4